MVLCLITANPAGAEDVPRVAPNLPDAVEKATDVFLVTVTDYYGVHYVEADIDTILMGSYVNKIWFDRRISEGDLYPFTPGERYVLFLLEIIGDTYKPVFDSPEWAIHPVNSEGLVDMTAFGDFGRFVSVEELRESVESCAEPFYQEKGE